MLIECITFDLDDTLWDCRPALERAERDFYLFLCEHLPRVTARYGEQGLLEHRHAHYVKHPDKTHDLTYMRKHWLAEIAQQFGYGAELVEPGFQVFWEGRNTVELFEGVEACLHALQGRFKIGAITNGNADVEYIGIGRYFDFVITSADAGASKPAAAIFEAALDAAEVEAASAVHVGDDPQRDVLGAAAVGMRTIWFNPTLQPWPGGQIPDAVVRDVRDLAPVLIDW